MRMEIINKIRTVNIADTINLKMKKNLPTKILHKNNFLLGHIFFIVHTLNLEGCTELIYRCPVLFYRNPELFYRNPALFKRSNRWG